MKKVIIIIFLLLEILLIINMEKVIIEFKNTLSICLYSLMPTMFFSIFFTNILSSNNFNNIFLLSILGGYPNNVKLLKNSNNEYLNYCTNFVNPLYFIGTIYNLYLKNIVIALIMLISHYLSSFIIYYFFKEKESIDNKDINFKESYFLSLKNTINTIALIFSNLLFISLLVTLLKLTLPFSSIINSFIIGLLEFSKGIYELSLLDVNIYLKGLLILIIITFGSFSIHFQIISINPKIKYIKYLLFRLLNVLISIIIYFILVNITN